VTPNGVEAQALTGLPVSDTAQGALAAKQLVAAGVQIAIITLGHAGLVYATPEASGYVPSIEGDIIDPTGAGDALTAAVVYALLNDIPVDEAVRLGDRYSAARSKPRKLVRSTRYLGNRKQGTGNRVKHPPTTCSLSPVTFHLQYDKTHPNSGR
jgi:fructose-1-phosphate kinase PfkB-like protein